MHSVYRLSSAVGKQRIPTFGTSGLKFGQAHYSWTINAQLYLKGLQAIREAHSIIAPDIYQHKIACEVAGLSGDFIHLVDKPLELLRPMFGRKNVSIMVWEFAEFSNEAIDGDPRSNQVYMLRQMDDVWCGSSFTQRSLAAAGISARFLPPPVAHFVSNEKGSVNSVPFVTLNTESLFTEPSDNLESFIRDAPNDIVFLAILAPFDLRKNLKSLIEGFLASDASKSSILLIKLVIDNVGTTVANINGILNIHYDLNAESDNVVFCGAYLSDQQMNALYGLATFFISAASAEGLNLPLLEAMARGLPAISPDHTAMADYISDERAIVVPTKRRLTEGAIHAFGSHLKTTHYPATKAAIRKAFDAALALDESSRRLMGQRGADFVGRAYGLEEFERRVSEFESATA